MLLDAVYEEKLEGAEGRAAELRYVTEHFNDLKGLQAAPAMIGGFLSLAFIRHGSSHIRLVLLGALGLLLFTWGWAAWLTRWYKARYGFITKPKAVSERLPGAGLLSWALLVLYVVLFSAPKHASIATVLLVEVQIFLGPICFAAAPSSRWILLRRLLYRATALAISALVVAAAFTGLFGKIAWLTFLAGSLFVEAYDHWLLGYLLRPFVLGMEANRG